MLTKHTLNNIVVWSFHMSHTQHFLTSVFAKKTYKEKAISLCQSGCLSKLKRHVPAPQGHDV